MEEKERIKPKQSSSSKGRGVRYFYLAGISLALLLYGSLDINIHTTHSYISSSPKFVVEFNLRRPRALEKLLQEVSSSGKFSYSEGEFDEENILSDPLTDIVLDSDQSDELQDEAGEDPAFPDEEEENEFLSDDEEEGDSLSTLELKRKEIQSIISNYKGPIRVALYTGIGTTTNAKNNIPHVLSRCSNGTILVQPFQDGSMSTIGRLRNDVLFIPGGSAGRIFTEMASHAKKQHRIAPQFKVRKFIEKGGGYIGVCAGAYLAAGGKSGKSPFKISMFKTESGMLGDGFFSGTEIDPVFASSQEFKKLGSGMIADRMRDSQLFYANGPIFKNETFPNPEFPQLRDPKIILRVAQDGFLRILVGGKRFTHRRHQGLPLLVTNKFGEGQVVLSTAHPETSVHDSSYTTWKQAREPSDCSSEEAKMLLAMVYIAAGRGPENIEI